MGNRKAGLYDPGATSGNVTEAGIVMDWANDLRSVLMSKGHKVVRTRVDAKDPAPIGKRAGIAKDYACEVMVSLHCNAANGTASGTETFYRGNHKMIRQPELEAREAMAKKLNAAVVSALETKNRGIKREDQSQHQRLAVMEFQPCFLIEIGFIDHPGDRAKMLDPELRHKACEKLAEILIAQTSCPITQKPS